LLERQPSSSIATSAPSSSAMDERGTHSAGSQRFERAPLRFHARLCAELPSVSLTGAAAALQASRRWAAATRVAAPRSSPRSSRPSAPPQFVDALDEQVAEPRR